MILQLSEHNNYQKSWNNVVPGPALTCAASVGPTTFHFKQHQGHPHPPFPDLHASSLKPTL